jgi:hypothetical protein
MSDSDLRQALLGTWRLSRHPFGDNPQGYLVYTSDEHAFVQFVIRAERNWLGPDVLEMTRDRDQLAALGFSPYCGTFEIRDGGPSSSGSKPRHQLLIGRGDRHRAQAEALHRRGKVA